MLHAISSSLPASALRAALPALTAVRFRVFVIYRIGFALVLIGGVALARLGGYTIDARRGLIWGAAGFVVFALAPAIGLPPELPGMEAAALVARQQWWFLTAAATAGGLGLIIFAKPAALRVVGIVLIVLPHLIGAPAP